MEFDNTTALRDALEGMETPQLDRMLLEELRKEAPNGQLIRQISKILRERDKELIPETDDHIQKAWEQYQLKTMPGRKKPRLGNSILIKAASLILVVLTLMVFLSPRAEAANFFQRLIVWTEDIFSFLNPLDADVHQQAHAFRTDNPGLQEVYDGVTALGVTVPVVPTWLPEGYELVRCDAINTPTKKYLTAEFSSGSANAVYRVVVYSDNTTSTYYKDGEIILETEKHGITHTILRNQDLLIAAWTTDNTECSICMDCPEETLLQILESIYTMEDES